MIYPVRNRGHGNADITSGEEGCDFNEEEDYDYECDNFSGFIDEDEIAYWVGTLITDDDES